MRRITASTAAIGLALILTACATEAPMSESTPTPSSTTRPPLATTTPGPIAPTGTPADVPEARWSAIRTDLTARGVGGEPTLVSAENVTFADGSLGCAEPGQAYTQAIVEGMRVVVQVDGVAYDYRFGSGDGPKLCTR